MRTKPKQNVAAYGIDIGKKVFHIVALDAEVLERVSQSSVLGQVPVIPGKTRLDTLNYLKSKPASAHAESIRNLRTSILMSNVDNPPQVILLSSAIPGEGKSTLTVALASNMAALGKRVLVIEGDARRQIFTEFGLTGHSGGLSDVLVDGKPVADVIDAVPDLNFDLLSAGSLSTNSGDTFSSDRFTAMIAELKGTYDFILVDTPPVLLVSDARLLARHADAKILVVKWNSASHQQIREALRQFNSAGQSLSGCVLNRVDPKGMKKYGYGKGYGAYSYVGSGYYGQ